jgi:nitroreductase
VKKIISKPPNPIVENLRMFNDTSDLQKYLATRRSGKPRDMAGARPDDRALHAIAALASRTPDHGKLTPWRMILVKDARRAAFKALLARAFRVANPNATDSQVATATGMADYDAGLIITTFKPQPFAKVPVWEQELSAGALAMNLLHAGHAYGFVGGWVSPWPCADATVRGELCEEGERITGLVYFGTPAAPLEERPRPDAGDVIRAF